jgi:hypothetical protein
MIILGSPFMFGTPNLIDAISSLSLTSSLQLCLDAGDASSYTSGQTWSDVSGNSNHFYRGSGSGSESNDPTFNGVAGRQSSSEYFSSDGNDAFWNTAKHSFPANWHKDGATYTVAGWIYIASGSTEPLFIVCNFYGNNQVGTNALVDPGTGKVGVQMSRGGAQPIQVFSSSASGYVPTGQWVFVAASFAEGTGTSFVCLNSTQHLMSSDSYVSPSSSAPNFGMAIWSTPNSTGTGVDTDTNYLPDNGSRIAELSVWNRALSQSEVDSLYNARKGKFGL